MNVQEKQIGQIPLSFASQSGIWLLENFLNQTAFDSQWTSCQSRVGRCGRENDHLDDDDLNFQQHCNILNLGFVFHLQ